MQKTEMNGNILVHVIFHVIYFKRDRLKRNFGQPRQLHYFVLKFRCSTTISATEVLIPGFFHCASVYVIVGCDAVSVSSQLDTYIDEMQAGGTIRVNAFEF